MKTKTSLYHTWPKYHSKFTTRIVILSTSGSRTTTRHATLRRPLTWPRYSARTVRAVHAIWIVVSTLDILSRRSVTHLVHGIVFHLQFGWNEFGFCRPGHVHRLHGFPRLVGHFLDSLVADLARWFRYGVRWLDWHHLRLVQIQGHV